MPTRPETHRRSRPTRTGQRIPHTSAQQRQDILERDGHRCVYCTSRATQVDHIIPVWWGGPSKAHNLVASCANCNGHKGADLDWPGIQILAEGPHRNARTARRLIRLREKFHNTVVDTGGGP